MTKETKKIRICSRHQERGETPLVWTFAFNGSEYWCPYCGATYGMLGAGDRVVATACLQQRLKEYKKASRSFLNAKSAMVCAYMTINGEKRTFDSLPPQTQSYYRNKAKSWKYKNSL